MEIATEVFAAILLLVIGLSHIAQPHAWVDYFIWLRGKGTAGAFVNGILCLVIGAFIVAFHNVWQGLPIVLTLFGWAQLLKGGINLVLPQIALRGMERVSHERAWHFYVGGGFALAISALMFYVVLSK